MKPRPLAISLAILALATIAPGASAQQPKPGGQIVHGSAQEPDRIWGPVTGLTVSGEISQLVNASLIEINDKLEYAPSLAVDVPTLDNGGISKDGLRYAFTLRPGVKWHDGAPFTSGDVAFTQTVLLNPDVDVRGRVGWNKISRVETPDDTTVIFQFSAIDAPFLDRVAALGILPRHILGKLSGAEIKAHKWFRAPVGTGPFVFKEWVPGSHLVLVKNPSYWKPGKPYLDRIIYKIVPDANALLNQLETGDIDTRLRLVNEHVDVVKKLPNVTLMSTPSIVPWLLWINQTGPPFNDKKVRQALAHGLDKERLTKTILGGNVTPAWQLLPPVSWAYNPGVVHQAFDPAKAKALLDESGWKPGADGVRVKDGKRLELLWIFGANNGYEEMAPLVQAMAREVGMDIQLREQPRAQMEEANRKSEHNIGEVNWWFPDPAIMTTNFHTKSLFGFNRPRLSNPEIDQMLDQAAAMTAEGPRMELYRKIQRTLFEMAAAYPLVDQVTIVGVRKEVKGYRFNVVTFPILYDVSLEK